MVEQLALMVTGPRVACKDCHKVFEDLSGHKLCDACLVEYINGAGELELDDAIDWETPRTAVQSSITCRVCGLGATVPLDHPALLCNECLADLDKTRIHVQKWRASLLAGLGEAKVTFTDLVQRSPAQGRWEAVQAALVGVAERRITQTVFDATWAKRKAEGGALAQLLEAHEVYARECDRLSAELARLHAAQREINAAWLAAEDL